MLSSHFISMGCKSCHRNVCTTWEQMSLLPHLPSPTESINGWLRVNKDRMRMYDSSLFKSSAMSNFFGVRRIFGDLMNFVCLVTFDEFFLQLLVQSVFELTWTLSLDKNSYRSMLHEKLSPFVCSSPGSYCLCVMVPSSYIGEMGKS